MAGERTPRCSRLLASLIAVALVSGSTANALAQRPAPDVHVTGTVLTVGVDAFNVLNSVNYGGYVGNMSSPFFGQPTSAQAARRMRLSVRAEFDTRHRGCPPDAHLRLSPRTTPRCVEG